MGELRNDQGHWPDAEGWAMLPCLMRKKEFQADSSISGGSCVFRREQAAQRVMFNSPMSTCASSLEKRIQPLGQRLSLVLGGHCSPEQSLPPKKAQLFQLYLGKSEFDGLRLWWFPPSCSGKNSSFEAKRAWVLISVPPLDNHRRDI